MTSSKKPPHLHHANNQHSVPDSIVQVPIHLDTPRVISPVQQCLPLFGATIEIEALAVLPDLRRMAAHVIVAASPHAVTAIQLKPAAGLLIMALPFSTPG
jgi:hypothetical protein